MKLEVKIIGGDKISIPLKGVIETPKLLIRQSGHEKASPEPVKSSASDIVSQLAKEHETTNQKGMGEITFEKQLFVIEESLTAHAPSIQRFMV